MRSRAVALNDLPPSPLFGPDPLAPLLEDHRLATAVLDAMEREALHLEVGTPVHVPFWEQVLAFFDSYFDRVHHPKEEELLLPLLDAAGFGLPHGPLARMRAEHARMTPWRQDMRRAVERRTPRELRAAVREFVDFHRAHMESEECLVFPLARAILGGDGRRLLAIGFDRLEHMRARGERRRAAALVHAIVADAAQP